MMRESYSNILKHNADFRVKYKFRSPEEGGRKTGTPYQGIRCDFSYADETGKQQYQIWPEFEDINGKIIETSKSHVPNEGTALMWIVNSKMRPVHYERIKVGLKGHFREGAIYSADCEVIEILDLRINPTEK